MKSKTILHIVGVRPHFIKLAILLPKLNEFNNIIVHTGQHYSYSMDDKFFNELNIPEPDYNLGINQCTNNTQIAKTMMALEPLLKEILVDLIMVYGDTNATLGGAIAGVNYKIPVAHVESNVRSYDIHMQEEINRCIVDSISTYLFSPIFYPIIKRKEGRKVYSVNSGDILLDSTIKYEKRIQKQDLSKFHISSDYIFITIHRAENLTKERLEKITVLLNYISDKYCQVVFPLHPHTKKVFKNYDLRLSSSIKQLSPVSYLETLAMIYNSRFVLTDSGGVQREAAFLGKYCGILRTCSEWDILCKYGVSILIDLNIDLFNELVIAYNESSISSGIIDKIRSTFGGGNASNEIAKSLVEYLK